MYYNKYLECCDVIGRLFVYILLIVPRCECSITDLLAIVDAIFSGIEQLIFFILPAVITCVGFLDYYRDERRLFIYFLLLFIKYFI